MIECKDLNQIVFYLAPIAVLLLESWLGKTNKTKSGSILELIINLIIAMFRRKGN